MHERKRRIASQSVSDEEYAKVQPLPDDAIDAALREGAEARRAAEEEIPLPNIAAQVRFR